MKQLTVCQFELNFHRVDMSWSCPVCEKNFSRKDGMQRHMSNKHGNPVFSPAMSSVPNCTEKCQQFCFVHQFTCMVAGMTGSGKTVWVKFLLQQAQKVIHLPPERAVWCYSQWQPAYMELVVTAPNIEFVKGIPSDLEYDTFFDINRRNLMVLIIAT